MTTVTPTQTHSPAPAPAARALPALAELRRLSGRLASGSGVWRRYAIPGSLAAILVGFAVIVQSWWDSGGTADIRVQMQDLISAVGGAALVLGGVVLLAGDLVAAWRRDSHAELESLTSTLASLAAALNASSAARGADTPAEAPAPTAASLPVEMVIATHASYHRPGCDLLEGRSELRTLTLAAAADAGLAPCRSCAVDLVPSP